MTARTRFYFLWKIYFKKWINANTCKEKNAIDDIYLKRLSSLLAKINEPKPRYISKQRFAAYHADDLPDLPF